MNSALRLERSFYDKVVVETVPDYKQVDGLSLSGDIGVEVVPSSDASTPWAVILTVTVTAPDDEPRPPYTVDVRAIGHFRWEGNSDNDDFEQVVGVNGASLLYSGMRELVGIITARGPWGQMLLPTLDFRSIRIVVSRPTEEAEDQQEAPKKTRRKQAGSAVATSKGKTKRRPSKS